jgi:hypothetical protein
MARLGRGGFLKRIKAFEASVAFHLTCGILASILFTFAFRPFTAGDAWSMLTFVSFNLLFVCLSFLLEGSLKRKLILLFCGDCLYLLLNRLLDHFWMSIAQSYKPLDRFYVVLGPFVNMIWIVSFWSFGLTFLAGSRKQGGSSES